MDNASYYDALEMKEELENLGYLKKKKSKQVHRPKKLHVETYITKDQIPIYVGKNNLQNDYLTFKMASKNDMWFHVKDMPGSHVVVHSQNLDEYTIRLASQMAAYFSKGKHSSSVPVNYTLVKTLTTSKRRIHRGIDKSLFINRIKYWIMHTVINTTTFDWTNNWLWNWCDLICYANSFRCN